MAVTGASERTHVDARCAIGALCFPKRPRRDSAEPPSGYVHLQDADFSLATSPPPSDDGSEGRPSLDAGPVPVLTTV